MSYARDPSHFLQSRNEANTFSLECALGAHITAVRQTLRAFGLG
jgi:hypothetical protein